ncbi:MULTISPECIES: 3-hydroxyacyl-CoA dehydrogenase family protein [Streptomyces]|uniref:3-hydroxyacyl-CoA dehydrogenase family protein n=1 Tax=Streptomyces TaxID=1883 RepID=UPI000CD53678|nr:MULTISPECIES: 3-hydroxyacyl-CoA dehydrogenase NAD-binding domain-containing protein [Streptomyces]
MAIVGVVGAGVMGTGVAQNLAQYGFETVLVDVSEEVLAEARSVITRNCRVSGLMGGPRLDPDEILGRITTAVGLESLAKADFVIENVTEDWETKRGVHAELDQVLRPDAVVIVNTSAIPITRVGAVGSHPERVVGVHFMNPVPAKPVVELIPGFHTSPEVVEVTRQFLADFGKKAVQVKDASGFVSNRVLMLTVNEAAFLVHEGVADAQSVDEVFRGCFGHPMGPLETADLIGVDTILYSVEVLYEHYADSKYRPCPLLKQMTDAGLHGRKTGRGFYTYATQE